MRLTHILLLAGVLAPAARGQDFTETLRAWDVQVYGKEKATPPNRWETIRAQRDRVNRDDRAAWQTLRGRADWETFRDQRLAALARALGDLPTPPKSVEVRVTKRSDGDGFVLENLVYQSAPGLLVTANRYLPAKPGKAMPGLIIVHSHHNPKTQGELQDMGMTWARQGCVVLVPDMIGHGERRQHPFIDARSYPGPFRVGRQDYYFRYNVGLQLHLIGESLVGMMARDLMAGVTLLIQTPGVDAGKIVLLGSVAGGGDPAAVTAALDRRIAAAVVFNFGGPQPETKYPLPKDAVQSFNYLGGGSWESTRNLRLSGRDGFLPWVIVGAIAPRRLVYAHEFAWDREHDPVWARLQTIWGWFGASDHLASAHGRGSVRGQAPESTHCNNIGPVHRKGIHAALQRWFNVPVPTPEYQKRRAAADLQCLTDTVRKEFKPQLIHQFAGTLADERLEKARASLAKIEPSKRRETTCKQWLDLLGVTAPTAARITRMREGKWDNGHHWQTLVVTGKHRDESVPVLLLQPTQPRKGSPVVVGLAQAGKAGFLKHRAGTIARLLDDGITVCLPDLHGAGERGERGEGRGRTSGATSFSSSAQMLGQTVPGLQLHDLLLVLHGLKGAKFGPVALWGDSFAPINDAALRVAIPLDAERMPRQAEPMGGLLALLGGLCGDPHQVRVVYARGGLVSYRDVLNSPFFYVPHEAVVPGVLKVGDLDDVAALLAPRPLRLEALVDGRNRRMSLESLRATYTRTRASYTLNRAADLQLRDTASDDRDLADWLARSLATPTR